MAYRGRKTSNKVVVPFSKHTVIDLVHTPKHLPPDEQKLFEQIAADHDIRSTSSAAILESAMEAHALIRSCRETIKQEGLVVKTMHGTKAHPLMNVQHSAHMRMLAALRRLGVSSIDE